MPSTRPRCPASRSARGHGRSRSATTRFRPPPRAAPSGLLKAFSGGTGTGASQGRVVNGALLANAYVATTITSKKSETIRLVLANGGVKDFAIEPEPPVDPDRIVVTDAHRKNVLDPMTGSMIRVPGNGDVLSPEACRTGAAIFDGRLRYDLKLDFKRMETVKAERGYHGAGRGLRGLLHAGRGLYPRPARDQMALRPAQYRDHLRADRGHADPGSVPHVDPDPARPRACWKPPVL